MTLYLLNDPLVTIALYIALAIGHQLLVIASRNVYASLPNPPVDYDAIDQMRSSNRRSRIAIIYSLLLAVMAYWFADYARQPALFTFFAGYVLLVWGPAYTLQAVNLSILITMRQFDVFTENSKSDGRIARQTAAVYYAVWGIFYVLFLFLTGNVLFAGGAVYTLIIALRMYIQSRLLKGSTSKNSV